MTLFLRQLVPLLFLGSLTASLQAQPVLQRGEGPPLPLEIAKPRFTHITGADGLPENSAREILQDHLGFIWICTQNGLVRYDGQTMTTFQHDPDDPYSIGTRAPYKILLDRAGDIWIGTTKDGLIHYSRTTGHFTSYRHDPDDSTSLSDDLAFPIHEDERRKGKHLGDEPQKGVGSLQPGHGHSYSFSP